MKLERRPGPGKKRLAAIQALDGTGVAVGPLAPGAATREHPSGGGTTVEILAIHEFGWGVPRRSVVSASLAENRVAAGRLMKRAIREGKSDEAIAETVGKFLVGEMIQRLDDGIDPPLVQSGDRGPNDTPLEDTMTIRGSLRWRPTQRGRVR